MDEVLIFLSGHAVVVLICFTLLICEVVKLETIIYILQFQVLINEAGRNQPLDNKSNKAVKGTPRSMQNKQKDSEETHIELDSRLLSALLTVSTDFVKVIVHDFIKYFQLFPTSPFAYPQGVNRAFPYVSSNEADDIVDIETPMLFQLVGYKTLHL